MFQCYHHHQGAYSLSLLKLLLLNNPLIYVGVVNLVVWLHMLSDPCQCVSAALYGTSLVPYSVCLLHCMKPD